MVQMRCVTVAYGHDVVDLLPSILSDTRVCIFRCILERVYELLDIGSRQGQGGRKSGRTDGVGW